MDTLLLDRDSWDLTTNVDGNIAVANEPYSLAQDAASAIKTFLGEIWWDTTIGLPYFTQILWLNPTLAFLKQQFVEAALTVPNVAAAKVFLTDLTDRAIGGQVQVIADQTGQLAAVNFAVVNPQGV